MRKLLFTGALLVALPFVAFAQTDTAPTDTCLSLQHNMGYRTRDAAVNGEVSDLQDYLNANGYLSASPSGYFGVATVAAVKKFQAASGLSATGYVGPYTRAAIAANTGCAGTPNVTPNGTTPGTTQTQAAPTISSTASATNGNFEADVGGQLTIKGSNFAANGLAVNLGGFYATVLSSSANTITIQVPSALQQGHTYDLFVATANGKSNIVSINVSGVVGTPSTGATNVDTQPANPSTPGVSVTSTSVSGTAPFTVTFTAQLPATSAADSYNMDFGDKSWPTGKAADCGAKTCTVTWTHTYMAPSDGRTAGVSSSATYIAKIHSYHYTSGDTCTISSPCAIAGPVVGVSKPVIVSTLPQTYLTATPMTGSSPLTVNFGIWVPQNTSYGPYTLMFSGGNANNCSTGQGCMPVSGCTPDSTGLCQTPVTATHIYTWQNMMGDGKSPDLWQARLVGAAGDILGKVNITVSTSSVATVSNILHVQLSSDTTIVSYGGHATISWNVTGGSSSVACVAAGSGFAPGTAIGTSGSWTTSALYTSAQYGIKCTDSSTGQSDTEYVTLTVPPQTSAAAAPIITTSPNVTIAFGQTTTITWSVSPSTGVSCVAAGGNLANGEPASTGGSWTTPTLYTTTQYGMKCTNASGASSYAYVTVTVLPQTSTATPATAAPAITLSPDTSIPFGGTTPISWGVSPATGVTCVAAGGNLANGTAIGTAGSWTTPALYSTTQYGIQCTNTASGAVSYKYMTVTVAPQTSASTGPVITTSPDATIAFGAQATINWSVSPSTGVSCVAAGGSLAAGTPIGTIGSWTSPALYATTQYVIRCTNSAGAASYKYVTITVPPQSSASGPAIAMAPTQGVVLGASTECINLVPNMHRGAELPSVKTLQHFLISEGLLSGSPTGFYGDDTVAAVKAYQDSKHLPTTGMVYDATRAAIKADTCQ